MKSNLPKPVPPHRTNWQLLGERQLPVGPAKDSALHAWLSTKLDSLALNEDLLGRITRSAQDALERAAESEHVRRDFKHLHLRVYSSDTTLVEPGSRQTWGFFRIEKVGLSHPDGDPMDHSIEVYLYLENQKPHQS